MAGGGSGDEGVVGMVKVGGSEGEGVEDVKVRGVSASSVSGREFGAKCAIDGSDATCWMSEPGVGQWIELRLEKTGRVVNRVLVQFQGGFAGIDVEAMGRGVDKEWREVWKGELKDTNEIQSIPFSSSEPLTKIKLLFKRSSDFYGRVSVINVRVVAQKKAGE